MKTNISKLANKTKPKDPKTKQNHVNKLEPSNTTFLPHEGMAEWNMKPLSGSYEFWGGGRYKKPLIMLCSKMQSKLLRFKPISDRDGSAPSSRPSRLTLWCFKEQCEDIWLDVIWLKKECGTTSCKSIRAWKMCERWKASFYLEMNPMFSWYSSKLRTQWRKFSCSAE